MPGPTPAAIASLLRSQLSFHPPVPTSSFEGQTVIITGANTGLGREAALHIVRLGAEHVILAVRNLAKGKDASDYIEAQTAKKGVVEVWQLDMSSYASVLEFGKRVSTLQRLDVVLENAGMWPSKFEKLEGHEATITVNVLSTFLLARLVIPKLQETAAQGHTTPRLSIVSSALHKFASLGAVKSPSILAALDERTEDYDARYQDSKLLLHLYGAKLAAELSTPGKPSICFNLVNPGYCVSQLKPPTSFATRMAENVMARSTDEGARTLVDAVAADKAAGRHGMYIDDMKVKSPASWLNSRQGQETKERVWSEINAVLDAVAPSVAA